MCGGNVHDQGMVGVSASSVWSDLLAQHAVDLDRDNYFGSCDRPNQWLCYDFKERRIQLANYSIAAHTNDWFLRSWVVEGSEDGSAWMTLDEHHNNTEANLRHPVTTVEVEPKMQCRFIRLRQTGKCAGNKDSLVLFGFEVFGLVIQ
jgi:hypothetical protein